MLLFSDELFIVAVVAADAGSRFDLSLVVVVVALVVGFVVVVAAVFLAASFFLVFRFFFLSEDFFSGFSFPLDDLDFFFFSPSFLAVDSFFKLLLRRAAAAAVGPLIKKKYLFKYKY